MYFPAGEIGQDLEFDSAVASRATRLSGPDHVSVGRLQRAALQGKVRIDRRDAGMAAGRHWDVVRLGTVLDVPGASCQNAASNSVGTEDSSHRSASVG